MIEFVNQSLIENQKLAYSTGAAFTLKTFSQIKAKLWDYHFNFRRWWEAANKQEMESLTLHLERRTLNFRSWYYQLYSYIHVNDSILGESDLPPELTALEGKLLGVTTPINDSAPGPYGAPNVNDYGTFPFVIVAVAPKFLTLRYVRDGFMDPTPGFVNIGSDTIRYLDGLTTTDTILDEEVTTPFLVIQANTRGMTDARVMPNGTLIDDLLPGQIKNTHAQIRSSFSNPRGHVYLLWERDDFIPSGVISAVNPRNPALNAWSNVFYLEDSDWTNSPFFPVGSTRNKNPDPTPENPGGDWLLKNNAPTLNDESEVDSYSYEYDFTDIDGDHHVTRTVSVKLREYSFTTDASRKVVDASAEDYH